jgi:RNA polymerase sigma-70 factor (ECF subfamily)
MTDEHARRSDDPDLALVRRMAAGEARALDELYAQHGPSILGFLVARLGDRQQSEEVLQDVMMAAWRNADSFRGDSSVRTWLLVIARNRATNVLRKNRPTMMPIHDEFELSSADTGPQERVERIDAARTVRRALDELPAQQREVLTLVFFHQMTGPEVAAVLGITVGTVKSRLFRAKERLRGVLPEGGLL